MGAKITKFVFGMFRASLFAFNQKDSFLSSLLTVYCITFKSDASKKYLCHRQKEKNSFY